MLGKIGKIQMQEASFQVCSAPAEVHVVCTCRGWSLSSPCAALEARTSGCDVRIPNHPHPRQPYQLSLPIISSKPCYHLHWSMVAFNLTQV
jgi:hypothetical protein